MTQNEDSKLLPNLDPKIDLKNQLESKIRTADQYTDDNFLLLFHKLCERNSCMREQLHTPNVTSWTKYDILKELKALSYEMEHQDDKKDHEKNEIEEIISDFLSVIDSLIHIENQLKFFNCDTYNLRVILQGFTDLKRGINLKNEVYLLFAQSRIEWSNLEKLNFGRKRPW